MIEVSNEWKEAHKQTLLPETFVEITMDIGAVNVNTVASSANEAPFSNTGVVVNNSGFEDTPKYAFLEHNLWSLDGTVRILPNDGTYHPPAYVSKDDKGVLNIRLLETSDTETPGITITWSTEYDTYATKFTVEMRKGATVVATTTVTDNTRNVSSVDIPVSNYDSVVITVQEWSLPNQRVRIDNVRLGHYIVFDKNNIIGYSHEQSGSPLGTELSKNAIEFEVDNSDGRWNLLNPTGTAKYLCERQKLVVRYGQETSTGVEWVQGGEFYLSEWRAPDNGITATFVARDVIEFMLNASYSRPYREAITTADVSVYRTKDDVHGSTAESVIDTIASGTTIRVYEESVQYPSGYGDDPEDPGWMTCRIDQGWIDFDYVEMTSDTAISGDLYPAIRSCIPQDSSILQVSTDTTFEGPIAINETPVATFVQNCLATCGITMWQRADGSIRIYHPFTTLSDYVISAETSYFHPEVELTKPLKQVSIINHYQFHPGTKTNTFDVSSTGDAITVDAPYMWKNPSRIEMLAKRYIAWWRHREVVSGEFRADPRLELFDVVQVETKYGTLSPVMITYLKYTYNGAFRGVYKGKVIATE